VGKPWVISSSRTASPRPVQSLQTTASYSYFRLVSLSRESARLPAGALKEVGRKKTTVLFRCR
jgi:hypothetical protein